MTRKPKKLLNHPNDVPAEQLEGLLYACHGKLSKVEGYSGVIRTDIAISKSSWLLVVVVDMNRCLRALWGKD